MKLSKIYAVSGLPGLYEAMNVRADGMIARSLSDNFTQFLPARKHNFSAIEQIFVYKEGDDTEKLPNVFYYMLKLEQEQGIAPPSPKAPTAELRQYFSQVLPEHDQRRVHTADIQKMIRWYQLLVPKNVIVAPEASTTDTQAATESEA